jgi:hypothetical protein
MMLRKERTFRIFHATVGCVGMEWPYGLEWSHRPPPHSQSVWPETYVENVCPEPRPVFLACRVDLAGSLNLDCG